MFHNLYIYRRAMSEQIKTPKRLLIDIPEELHRELKSVVALRGITLKKYVIRAIRSYLLAEPK